MAININGTKRKVCNFNGVKCKKVVVNGVTVKNTEVVDFKGVNTFSNGELGTAKVTGGLGTLEILNFYPDEHGEVSTHKDFDVTDFSVFSYDYYYLEEGDENGGDNYADIHIGTGSNRQIIGFKSESGVPKTGHKEHDISMFDTVRLYFATATNWNNGKVTLRLTNCVFE